MASRKQCGFWQRLNGSSGSDAVRPVRPDLPSSAFVWCCVRCEIAKSDSYSSSLPKNAPRPDRGRTRAPRPCRFCAALDAPAAACRAAHAEYHSREALPLCSSLSGTVLDPCLRLLSSPLSEKNLG